MIISKRNLLILGLCLIHGCLSKPTDSNTAEFLSEARGFGSTLWGWISYPFSWWTESDMPNSDHLYGSTTRGPNDNIEVGRRNVTVWCNEQTCTTMRCDRNGCYNMTCNIYDTDLMGECRVYNTFPTKPVELKPIEITTQATTVTKEPEIVIQPTASVQQVSQTNVEQPLELEAVLSSTINNDTENTANVSTANPN